MPETPSAQLQPEMASPGDVERLYVKLAAGGILLMLAPAFAVGGLIVLQGLRT